MPSRELISNKGRGRKTEYHRSKLYMSYSSGSLLLWMRKEGIRVRKYLLHQTWLSGRNHRKLCVPLKAKLSQSLFGFGVGRRGVDGPQIGAV